MGSVPTEDSDGNDALKRKRQRLERDVAYLRSAKSTTGKAGTKGTSKFYDSANRLIAIIGTRADGAVGLTTFRADGSAMFESFINGAFGASYTAIRDKFSNLLFFDDLASGGLARPRLTMGQWVPNAPMGSTPTAPTTSTYLTMETAEVVVQAPWIRVTARVSSTGTATGNIRILDGSGAQVGSTLAIPVGGMTDVTLLPTALPASSPFGTVAKFLLQANQTGGTGAIGVRGCSIIGSASSDTA